MEIVKKIKLVPSETQQLDEIKKDFELDLTEYKRRIGFLRKLLTLDGKAPSVVAFIDSHIENDLPQLQLHFEKTVQQAVNGNLDISSWLEFKSSDLRSFDQITRILPELFAYELEGDILHKIIHLGKVRVREILGENSLDLRLPRPDPYAENYPVDAPVRHQKLPLCIIIRDCEVEPGETVFKFDIPNWTDEKKEPTDTDFNNLYLTKQIEPFRHTNYIATASRNVSGGLSSLDHVMETAIKRISGVDQSAGAVR